MGLAHVTLWWLIDRINNLIIIMKIGYYSDLHLEFQALKIKNDEADAIVLAGDMHFGDQ